MKLISLPLEKTLLEIIKISHIFFETRQNNIAQEKQDRKYRGELYGLFYK